jgi:signal peptidase I
MRKSCKDNIPYGFFGGYTIKISPMTDNASSNATLEPKEDMGEFFKSAIIAVLLALVIRSFLFEPFNIPSGSMLPTLKVGDYLFVSKPAYGYSRASFPFGIGFFDGRQMAEEPKRGDVAVFKLPTDTSIDYIKRVMGLPGETVQVIKGRVYIDGKILPREPVGLLREENPGMHSVTLMEYIETLPDGTLHRIWEESDNAALDNTDAYKIPEGHYFMMGDNRDNSQDSRVQTLVGFVPFENFVGRADLIFFSIDETANLFKPWSWFSAIRYDRIFDRISPVRPSE